MPPIETQRRQELGRALANPATFATSLIMILLDEFGTEVFEWEPETVTIELASNYNVEIPDENMDKIWSMITALTTNQFYVSVEMFNVITQSLMGEGASFDVFIPADPEDIAWGVTEVLLNDPPEDGEEFSQEVQRYAGLILSENGIFQKPTMLDFAVMPRENPVLDLDTAFTDDPIMFQTAFAQQKQKVELLEAFVKTKLEALMTEIVKLPLQNRDPKFLDNLRKEHDTRKRHAQNTADILAGI